MSLTYEEETEILREEYDREEREKKRRRKPQGQTAVTISQLVSNSEHEKRRKGSFPHPTDPKSLLE